jgi:DNA-binding CsgD family transcriptional regulator
VCRHPRQPQKSALVPGELRILLTDTPVVPSSASFGEPRRCLEASGERVGARGERAELGVDHAAIGGTLIRRWGLPVSLATAIEEHHNPEADGEAALLRVADMLAHHEQGAPIAPRELLRSARAIGLGPQELRRLMYELPGSSSHRQLPTDPCPLTGQELRVLQQLGRGRVYKEIAYELGLSASTIRTHLHNIYHKLGVDNRAQAVLFATGRGWL